MDTQYIVVDLEMNPVSKKDRDARKGLGRETIEIGAVKLDASLAIIDRFRCYVKPQHNREVTSFITELTGISTGSLNASKPFAEAMKQFEAWIGYDVPAAVYSWSLSDLEQLQTECAYKQTPFPENLKNWIDFQPVYAEAMRCGDGNLHMALHTAAEQFGIQIDDRKAHSALYDAEITTKLFAYVFSGECERQAELLHTTVLQQADDSGCPLGDLFGGVLQQLLCQT